MDRWKPSVLITTYSASSGRQLQDCTGATNSELVTNLFNKRNRRNASNFRLQLDLSQIKGPTGTIRGHKDVVKKSLENIQVVSRLSMLTSICDSTSSSLICLSGQQQQQPQQSNLAKAIEETYKDEIVNRLVEDEIGQCVAYTTSLGVIRRTFEDSRQMRTILSLNLIQYEERDIYLNQEFKQQLKLRCKSIIVPALFMDGHFVGGIKELEEINESGQLKKKFGKFKMLEMSLSTCQCCGNAKFIACQSCNGSRKSAIHHFKFNSVALRCIKCDKNDGLVPCPLCSKGNKRLSLTKDLNNNDDDDDDEEQEFVNESRA